jgi:hypothetical protein
MLAVRIKPRFRDYGLGRVALAPGAVAVLAVLLLGPAPKANSAHPPTSFAGPLAAQVSNRSGQALAMTSVSGSAEQASRRLSFRIDMLGAGEQVAVTEIQLRYAGSRPAACAGTVTQLDTSGFVATCRFADGTTQNVHASWQLSGSSLSGTLQLAPRLLG